MWVKAPKLNGRIITRERRKRKEKKRKSYLLTRKGYLLTFSRKLATIGRRIEGKKGAKTAQRRNKIICLLKEGGKKKEGKF